MIHKLLAGKGKMKRGLSLLLCLALLGSSLITTNVTAEAESEVAVEVVENSDTEEGIISDSVEEVMAASEEDTLSEEETEVASEPTEEIAVEVEEAATEAPVEETTEKVIETTSETSATVIEDSSADTAIEQATEEIVSASERTKTISAENTETTSTVASVADETVYTGNVTLNNSALVTVKASAKVGTFPEGTAISVTLLDAENEETAKQYDEAEAALEESNVEYDGFAALDISFYDVNGVEVEPENDVVSVMIVMNAEFLDEDVDVDSLAVQHLAESADGDIEVKPVADMADNTDGSVAVNEDENTVEAEFVIDSFSTVTITWRNMTNPSTSGYSKTKVNFYVNLYSSIANNTEGGSSTDAENFSRSVKSTYLSGYPSTFTADDSETGAYIVIQGSSNGSAYDVDAEIRRLSDGYLGFTVASFPTDEEVFNFIKSNYDYYTKGNGIKINGVTVEADDLTTDNYEIRWYVFKYNITDAWHIDGILVPKYGRLTVTKTFVGLSEDDITEIEENFKIEVESNDGEHSYDLKLTEKTSSDSQNNPGYDSKTVSGDTITYTWTLDVLNKTYKISESGYEINDWNVSSTYSKNPNAESGDSTVTEGDYTSDGFQIKCVTKATDTGSTALQSVSLTNNYSIKEVKLSIAKTVSGNMGDTNKSFTFYLTLKKGESAYKNDLTVKYNDGGSEDTLSYSEDTSSYSFTLKHGQSISISIPSGYTYKVTENSYSSEGYTTTVGGNTTLESSGTASEDISITYVNDKTVSPPTGLTRDVAPYVAALAIALGGAVLMFVSRRRRV